MINMKQRESRKKDKHLTWEKEVNESDGTESHRYKERKWVVHSHRSTVKLCKASNPFTWTIWIGSDLRVFRVAYRFDSYLQPNWAYSVCRAHAKVEYQEEHAGCFNYDPPFLSLFIPTSYFVDFTFGADRAWLRWTTVLLVRKKWLCVSVYKSGWPLLILCFSPDRIPGVSMILMLSRTGFGIWAHMNLQRRWRVKGERESKSERVLEMSMRGKRVVEMQKIDGWVFIHKLGIKQTLIWKFSVTTLMMLGRNMSRMPKQKIAVGGGEKWLRRTCYLIEM